MDENTIPAFSTWEMFTNTIRDLLKMDNAEGCIRRLSKMITDYSNILIYSKDPTLTYEQYKDIADKYKAFTVWLLGRFFYMSSCENLSSVHDVIIEVQISILDQMSKTLPHIHREFVNEYGRILNLLSNYLRSKNVNNEMSLDAFIPDPRDCSAINIDLSVVPIKITNIQQCQLLITAVLKIYHYEFQSVFILHKYDDTTSQCLDNFIYLMASSTVKIKLDILNIYIVIMSKDIIDSYTSNNNMKAKLHKIFTLAEQLIYEVYTGTIKIDIKETHLFENLLINFLESAQKENTNITRLVNIARFICNETLTCKEINKMKITKRIKQTALILLEGNSNTIGSNDFSNTLLLAITECNILFLSNQKSAIIKEIIDYHKDNPRKKEINIFNQEVSKLWHKFVEEFTTNLHNYNCKTSHCIKEILIYLTEVANFVYRCRLELHISLKDIYLSFFNEAQLFPLLLEKIECHITCCTVDINDATFLKFFSIYPLLVNSKNCDIIFHIVSYPLVVPSVYKTEAQMPNNFVGISDVVSVKNLIKKLYNNYLQKRNISQATAIEYTLDFFKILSCNIFVDLSRNRMDLMETAYYQIAKQTLTISTDPDRISRIMESVSDICTIFDTSDALTSSILTPALSNQNVLKSFIKMLPILTCISHSDYTKVLTWDTNMERIKISVHCQKCCLDNYRGNDQKFINTFYYNDRCVAMLKFHKSQVDLAPIITKILNCVLGVLSSRDTELKLASVATFPALSNHVIKFNSVILTKIWLKAAGDNSTEVRRKFNNVLFEIMKNSQESTLLSTESKKQVLQTTLETLLELTKTSLKFSNYELQNTLLSAVGEMSSIKCKDTILPVMEILIYFIMFPTSKYSIIAVNRFFSLAKKHGTNSELLYLQYKKELCKVIVHLCTVNQQVINYDLEKSLGKVSLVLGFHGTKEFVSQACQYLLPHFIVKVGGIPKVSELIEEIAKLCEMELPELLTTKYGNIFLHVFLNESKEDFRQCMNYLEGKTMLGGATLRKRNFKIILNELLLNFHTKRDRVLLALNLLSKEEYENHSANISDYLQAQFLGILLYFDMKLIDSNCTSKDEILMSLADFFKLMGPKHVTPLRFKIVAMLTTPHFKEYPELNCGVWEAFIKSCEIETLGPQLARIVVFLMPQIEQCPSQVNTLLKYLVVDNEVYTSDYIKDLFFVNNNNVEESVLSVIKKYSIETKSQDLRDKIKCFLKYLNHETIEVRIQGFKHMKLIMEQNREEVGKMILGYNGIDSVIVELIEIISLASREKDDALKLACGELIGELGAVEPSHLPRRYAQETKSFTFFMQDEIFLLNTLNELIKAFQAENNTQNTDRFALAIQEVLKAHEISPDESSSRNNIWKQLSNSQQEIVTPFLSSKYIIAQQSVKSTSKNHPCPIYGSSSGTSFESWLYNWTCTIIADLPNERKSFLESCLPSMKLNQRILMHFLPHIFLDALIEGKDGIGEKCYIEMNTIISSITSEKFADDRILQTRPLPLPGISTTCPTVATGEVKHTQCLKVVFALLNFIDRWLREWQWQKGLQGRSNSAFKTVKILSDRFCKLSLAKSNFKCQEYPRALMYLEDYVNENKDELYNNLSFFAEIYAELDEADGVAGVTALQHSEPSMEQRILALEVSSKLADAAACYEKIPPPLKLHHLQGLIQCYLDLDNVNTALNFAQGAMDLQPEFGNMLLELQAEPLWRLGRYDELDNLVIRRELVNSNSWGVQIGKSLIGFRQDKQDEFHNVLEAIKTQQVKHFGAANLEEGAYQHGYRYISKLHAIAELEQVEKTVHELLIKPNDKNSIARIMKQLVDEWQVRIKVVQETAKIIEPVLCLRRVSVDLAKNVISSKVPQAVPYFDSLLGELWLYSVRIARRAGNYQQAYTYTLKAEEYVPPKLFLEKAKLHWLREEHEQALTTLKRGVDLILPSSHSSSAYNSLSTEQRKLCAEAKLLIASYNDLMSNVDVEVNTQHYREAIEVYKEWEKSLVLLGQYYDRLLQQMSPEDRDSKGSDMQLYIISNFGKSLLHGTTYVYQSMPRLLSVWFDYGTRLLDVTNATVREERKSYLLKMTKLVDWFVDKLPSYVFLTAFSQIVSRICHPQKEVYIELKSIIIKLLLGYPQQTLWIIISVIKSDYAVRSKRCAEILSDPQLKTTSIAKLVKDFTALAEKLIELCNKEIAHEVTQTTVSAILRTLPRMLNKADFSEIMIPTYKFRKLVLPNPDFKSSQHNPFPNHYVHIVSIDDVVTILPSLQKPRKISFRGSDGKSYTQMLKPKDDLRKDFRLMEFNDIVNQLLSRDPEARQRRLHIRLYSVAPLNEECGLIEWVPNLVGFRPILMNIYKQRGIGMKGKELKDAGCNLRDPLAKKREVFFNILLKRHPPVLSDWFRKIFPDAQNWFTARTAYTRTTAVMSMVGYILGLGDRHGENISLDSVCGDIVHVDFNCLFNKGESFEWPERVPFRLTHNMVAAMGPLGVEGIFRKSCASTLRVLRTNSTTLISTVTPFVYDPLVHWPRNQPSSHAHSAERTNEHAVEHIKNIELRLSGIVKTRTRSFSIPLSVDGQTNHLINEAMSADNLCQMYIGWGPFL